MASKQSSDDSNVLNPTTGVDPVLKSPVPDPNEMRVTLLSDLVGIGDTFTRLAAEKHGVDPELVEVVEFMGVSLLRRKYGAQFLGWLTPPK